MATRWQQLGAYVITAENVSDHQLNKFADCGGKWIVVVLVNDDSVAEKNRALLPQLKARCVARGINVGIHANGFGDDPKDLAQRVASLAYGYKLDPVMYDLEAQYQHPQGNAALLPETLLEARKAMPGKSIGVTSFGFADRGMIWNGRTLSPPMSLYDLKIRWSPQWYYKYIYKYDPEWCMKDLKEEGATDFNIKDATAPGGRGIPLAYAHGVVYTTGLDQGHELKVSIEQMHRAKVYGFTYGFQIWNLENCSDSDFALLANEKGKLFLV